jgi:hypothetical protein
MEYSDHHEKKNSQIYEICLKGELSPAWANWFAGFNISCNSGFTRLIGPITDQAAMNGLLRKILDLELPILSINTIHKNDIEKWGSSSIDTSDTK